MRVKINAVDWSLSTEIHEGTVQIEINGNQYYVSSIHEDYQAGEYADVEFSAIEAAHEWEERFGKNTDNRKCLTRLDGWSYAGYGVVVSINPVVADFGDIRLDLGNWTNDKKIIGEDIYWPILELRMHKMTQQESL